MSEIESTPAQSKANPNAPESFYDSLRTFLHAMEAARDLEQMISDNAAEMLGFEARFTRIAARLMPSVDAKQHRRAASVIHALVHERMDKVSALEEESEVVDEDIKAVLAEYRTRISAAVEEISGHSEGNYHYATVWQRAVERPPSTQVLAGSLLMGAVSDFEVLVSALVRRQLAEKPQILRSIEQKFTFQDLEAFASLADFRRHVAEKTADGLLRGGFDEWMDWFAKRHKIVVAGVTDCPVELVEVFQRRHLLVHNGGVVNDYYLTKVSNLDDLPAIGTQLQVRARYLRRAIDLLTVAGIKLAFSVSNKVSSGVESLREVDHMITHVNFDLLREARYEVVREVSDWHLGFVSSDSFRLVAMVNRWLAQKQLEGAASIRKDVEEWDTGTLAGRYKLVRLALLDRYSKADALAKRLLAGEELSEQEWHTWPVLEGVRTYSAVNDMAGDQGLYEAVHLYREGEGHGAPEASPSDSAS